MKLIVPESGDSKRLMLASRVLFPAPLGPISAITSPAWTSSDTSFTTVTWPKDTRMSESSSSGVPSLLVTTCAGRDVERLRCVTVGHHFCSDDIGFGPSLRGGSGI
ncbi:hypothetical protein [Microbacterium elymi]|uniref:Uncharacterized protein n=1 Tax=Microbacterium elymi TaxID=2909587 RepID=A0ABY5NM11_9MICO|nr:hypothetical protein [Microbacterium elymi]UUT36229.1 hypothetical protein L2X98_24785 [Microbacterium elymi]